MTEKTNPVGIVAPSSGALSKANARLSFAHIVKNALAINPEQANPRTLPDLKHAAREVFSTGVRSKSDRLSQGLKPLNVLLGKVRVPWLG